MTGAIKSPVKILLACIGVAAIATLGGCASITSPSGAKCAAGEEAVRIGPRGKGDAPLYVCRDASE